MKQFLKLLKEENIYLECITSPLYNYEFMTHKYLFIAICRLDNRIHIECQLCAKTQTHTHIYTNLGPIQAMYQPSLERKEISIKVTIDYGCIHTKTSKR